MFRSDEIIAALSSFVSRSAVPLVGSACFPGCVITIEDDFEIRNDVPGEIEGEVITILRNLRFVMTAWRSAGQEVITD